jgi:hypothetical protein
MTVKAALAKALEVYPLLNAMALTVALLLKFMAPV